MNKLLSHVIVAFAALTAGFAGGRFLMPKPETPAAVQVPSSEVLNPVQSYPRGTKVSTEFIGALEKLGASKKTQEGQEIWRVRDLSCAFAANDAEAAPEGADPKILCVFQDEGTAGAVEKSGEAAELMRSLLFRYPVSQGDPGASTPWLECTRGHGMDSCTLGMNVDYDGP